MTYNDLRAHWYKKLADTGFHDIEHINEDGTTSHLLATRARPAGCSADWTATYEYYSICSEYYWVLRAQKRPTKAWKMHCDGKSCRQIARKMRKSSTTIFNLLKIIEENMWVWWRDRAKCAYQSVDELDQTV
jgi:hypothetical protein